MPDFRQVASQLNQAKEEVAGVWIRILEVDEGDAPEDHPLEEHMRAVDVLFERAMEDLDPMNSRAEEIVSGYCEMALSVFSDARSAAFHSKFREVPARQSLKAVHELAEMATARAFREAAEEEDAIV